MGLKNSPHVPFNETLRYGKRARALFYRIPLECADLAALLGALQI